MTCFISADASDEAMTASPMVVRKKAKVSTSNPLRRSMRSTQNSSHCRPISAPKLKRMVAAFSGLQLVQSWATVNSWNSVSSSSVRLGQETSFGRVRLYCCSSSSSAVVGASMTSTPPSEMMSPY